MAVGMAFIRDYPAYPKSVSNTIFSIDEANPYSLGPRREPFGSLDSNLRRLISRSRERRHAE